MDIPRSPGVGRKERLAALEELEKSDPALAAELTALRGRNGQHFRKAIFLLSRGKSIAHLLGAEPASAEALPPAPAPADEPKKPKKKPAAKKGAT